ncbi:unnamed protein product, partial [Ectocarpus fasciculatus]
RVAGRSPCGGIVPSRPWRTRHRPCRSTAGDAPSDVDVRACNGNALQNRLAGRSDGVSTFDVDDGCNPAATTFMVRTCVYWLEVLYLLLRVFLWGGTARVEAQVKPMCCGNEYGVVLHGTEIARHLSRMRLACEFRDSASASRDSTGPS